MTQTQKAKSQRLLSLDILRGITIAGMLLVNNPGSWGNLYEPLGHAEWIGLTPTDLVFPFFMFVMGVSMFFSLRKFEFKLSGSAMYKICRRTIILFLIGWAVQWFSMGLRTIFVPDYSFAARWIDHLRILGVFQRLALVYFFGSVLALTVKTKFMPWLIGAILVAYAVILGMGHGYEFSMNNIVSKVDLSILGDDHMYHESAYGLSMPIDPEGILSTLACVAHVLIGFMVGKIIIEHKDNTNRAARIALLGFAMLLGGWLLSYGIPCSKKIWTSSYVLITCGLAASVLALLLWVIDVKGRDKWCRFFQAFGVNPLFCYLMGTILSIAFGVVVLGHSADFKRADTKLATELLAKADAAGDVAATNNLALAYLDGKGVDEDKDKAIVLLENAAAKGSNEAKFNLWTIYKDNAATNAKALQMLLAVADSLPAAQFNLAVAEDYGLWGIKQDHEKAAERFALAAAHGVKSARYALEWRNGKENGLSEVYSDAQSLLMTGTLKAKTDVTEPAESTGKTITMHSLITDLTDAVTTSPKASSCLYAIIFVLITWLCGYVLYKKKIYIKI